MTEPTNPPKKRGRPPKSPSEKQVERQSARSANKAAPPTDPVDDLIGTPDAEGNGDLPADMRIDEVFRGVSLTWLAQAFGMDKATCRKRLAHCPPIGKVKNYEVYSLRQASAYLVEPKIDLSAYIKSLKPTDLPSILQDTYWSAMIKRQKWEENAGHLWRTDDVLSVFGELAMTLKTTITLWVEDMHRSHSLSAELRTTMKQQADNLLTEIHRIMVDSPARSSTRSTVSEMDDGADGDVTVRDQIEDVI